jgi:alpha-tubulin suppressor-like RCC1 family protein
MTTLGSLIRVCLPGIAVAVVVACGGGDGGSGESKRALGSTTMGTEPYAVAIAAGGYHNCAVTNAGGLKCWGWNGSFQLGDGTMSDRPVPVDTAGLSSGVAAIAGGGYHTCALTAGGGVKCWGNNGSGQVGNGLDWTYYLPTPTNVFGLTSGVAAVAAGYQHTCAVTSSGGAKCWGENRDGQLGDGTITRRLTPADVAGLSSGVTAIATGTGQTCALTSAGGVKCWGGNDTAQLGDGTTATRLTPVDVVGLSSGVAAIAAGGGHTCALTRGGGVKCWGYNSTGQLGDGTSASRLTPVDVVGLSSGVTAIAAGTGHTCALTSSGGVKCWGSNGNGALGDGTAASRLAPVDVVGLSSGVAAIAAGYGHTCALTGGGAVKCWGNNGSGQLGDGTTVSRLAPADVVGFTANEATNLENPHPGAHVSGIGLVSGWTCRTGVVEVSFDGGPRDNLVPSGGGRGDTLPVCGRTNTGFGLLFNYNLLGGGNHTVELFINGVQVGSPVPFTVTVPVGEFIRGAAKTVDAFDFPEVGKTTRLEWQESTQNFAITGVTGPASTMNRLSAAAAAEFASGEATNLENPYPGAHVSGIGLVSGWTCRTGIVEVSFDGGPRDNLVPSGGGRGDTRPVCGRANTGFGLLFNYNLLGSGNHTVELFINGVQVGSPVPFTVTVLAGEFMRGAVKAVDATDFPAVGRTTRLEWQESTQNFAITGVR